MGRLPSTWADRVITDRVPYSISGELLLTAGSSGVQFPDNTFSNNTDKPFEIHRLIPRVYAVDSDGTLLAAQPDQDLLAGLIRTNINDLGLNQILTKNPTLVGLLTKGSSERTWEFADPHYLTRGNQIQITNDLLVLPTIANLNRLKLAINLQGFFLVVAPPSENR